MKILNQQANIMNEDAYTEELEEIAKDGPIFVDDKDEEELSDFSYIDNYGKLIYSID